MRKRVLCLVLAAFVSLTGCAKGTGTGTADKSAGAPGSAAKTQSPEVSAPDNQQSGAAAEAEAKAPDAVPEENYEFQGKAGENVNWYYKDGVLTLKGTGDMSSDIFEADMENTDVMEKVTSVVIEKGITSICDAAFNYCPNLAGVTVPDSVTRIGIGAFDGDENLTSINIPDSVTIIDIGAFVDCNLDEATIAKIEAIGGAAATDPSIWNQ